MMAGAFEINWRNEEHSRRPGYILWDVRQPLRFRRERQGKVPGESASNAHSGPMLGLARLGLPQSIGADSGG
jgi:hypothetical protein